MTTENTSPDLFMNSLQRRSFESQIAYMNITYKLPLPAFPTAGPAIEWQREYGTDVFKKNILLFPQLPPEAIMDRLEQFFGEVLTEEVN